MSSSTSIRTYLVLMVLAVTVPLTVLGGYVVWSEAKLSRELADERVTDAAATAAEVVGQFVRDGALTLEGLSSRPSIVAMEPAQCEGFVDEANEVLLHFTNLFVVAADGELLCSAVDPPPDRTSATDAAWWEGATAADGFYAAHPQWGRISLRWITVLSHPIRSPDGSVIGYVGASVAIDRLRALIGNVQGTGADVVTLAHVDGTVLARTDDRTWTGRMLPGTPGGSRHAELGTGIEQAEGIDGVDRVWAFHTVPGTDWIVYAGAPRELVYAGWQRDAVATGAGVVLLVVLLSGLAFGLYRRINRSLKRLVSGAELAADRGVPHIPTDGPAEVVAVAQALNRTLAERARAESGLRRSTERRESILRNSVFGIYASTPDGRVLEANPALARMLGFSDTETLLSMRMQAFYRDPAERTRLVESSLEGSGTRVEEVEWVRRDGSPLYARLYATIATDPAGDVAFEVLVEDLTERRELEEQLRQAQKLEAVGTLAGGVAHDFNNRLTVMQGQAEMLLADLPDDDPLRANAEAILDTCRKASDLTGQLLAFSRKEEAQARVMALDEVVRGMEGFLPRLVGEDVTVEVELNADDARIMADPRQVEQILMNLATNARDAMPDGGRLLIATDVCREDDGGRRPPGLDTGDYVRLIVTDEGQGMTDAVRRRIFEPFFTTKPEGKGTGLGLSTAYGMVTRAGGVIEVESHPGDGTTFQTWWPRVDGEAAAAGEPPRTPGIARTVDGIRVLVVEDEDAVRSVVVRTLERAGYDVLEAGTGAEALALTEELSDPPRIMVTDVVMPGMRGGELADEMTSRHPGLRVLFISGYAEEAPTDLIGESSMRAFMPKPFTPTELLDRLTRLCEEPAATP